MSEISVAYHGYVFDASGYGAAARAYIHALHEAGVRVAVTDLAAARPRQVEAPLVARLVDPTNGQDFHLYHGIPTEWGAQAFRRRDAIGMTVWETDTMPAQWRNVLGHVADLWLPSRHNEVVFSAALRRPVFRLPHPIYPGSTAGITSPRTEDLGIDPGDFVFYSIFEWQARKGPEEVVESFLRGAEGFPAAILFLKTSPASRAVAVRAIAEVQARVGIPGRVILHAAAWSDAQLEALHGRGDCYLSLHRGEGWGYPLFEAARRGKPVIATAFGGPLDYLREEEHALVRWTPSPVRQPYHFYHPSMRWAEPDLAEACERVREVLRDPAAARARAHPAAERLERTFALAEVGGQARAHLMELLQRTSPHRRKEMARERLAPPGSDSSSPIPIPPEWYDADYFETGLKSNWNAGYSWQNFSGLFGATADFLMRRFPNVQSVLDVGCARGFLVRALRERGRSCWGIDHSRWALDRAEPEARPYLALQAAETVEFTGGPLDLIVAFDLLAHLTEQQIQSFLSRASRIARVGILATIAVFDSDREVARFAVTDRDLSRLQRHSRSWWLDRFVAAGWRQDPLHLVLQRECQLDPLPTRMGWSLFLLAPSLLEPPVPAEHT